MNRRFILILTLALATFVTAVPFLAAQEAGAAAGAGAATPTAQEILERMDAQKIFGTASYRAVMEIDLGRRVLRKEMRAFADGETKAFIEFTNPEDRGVRYLKIDDELWMYFPDEAETVKISGHLLKEGMMGSDLSYEDALETGALAEKYTITLAGSEEVDGRKSWVLELVAKVKKVPYEKQKIWIDAERYVSLKGEMYARSGKLLKTSRALAVERIGDRWYVTKLQMEDSLKKGSGTTFTMEEIAFDVELPDNQFTMRALTRRGR